MIEGFEVRDMGEDRFYPYRYGFTIYQIDRTNVGAARINNQRTWDKHIQAITKWCFDHFGETGERWALTHGLGYYWFNRDEDALAFKLRWW